MSGRLISRFKARLFPMTLLVFPKSGAKRRIDPFSRNWGLDRGRPVDRYYIEEFLRSNRALITGRVLEVESAGYTNLFGSGVSQADVIDLTPAPGVTIVGSLTAGDSLPSDAFDCIVLVQTLHLIDDLRAAVETIHRALKPGGTALVTLPGISQIARDPDHRWFDRWRFTKVSARELFSAAFPKGEVNVIARGNVLTSTAFLYGLSDHELTAAELEYIDPDYELIIFVAATKAV